MLGEEVRAGKLRHRITIQYKSSESPDSAGNPQPVWADEATVWGSVEPLSGREFFAAQQVNSEVTHRITMRYRSGMDPEKRIKFGTRYFGILAVLNREERNISLELLCVEVPGVEIQ